MTDSVRVAPKVHAFGATPSGPVCAGRGGHFVVGRTLRSSAGGRKHLPAAGQVGLAVRERPLADHAVLLRGRRALAFGQPRARDWE
jgi:hypothetical protein